MVSCLDLMIARSEVGLESHSLNFRPHPIQWENDNKATSIAGSQTKIFM
jgi:hypothetical protein